MITAIHLTPLREIEVVELPEWTPTEISRFVGRGPRLHTRSVCGLGKLSLRRALAMFSAEATDVDPTSPLATWAPALVIAHAGTRISSMTPVDLTTVAAHLVTREHFTNPVPTGPRSRHLRVVR